jgi:hypothetical protein
MLSSKLESRRGSGNKNWDYQKKSRYKDLESKSSRQKKWAVILRETRTKLKEM